MTTHEIREDWRRCFAGAASPREAVWDMKTETLRAFAETTDPKGDDQIGRFIREELARRASWDGYVDTEGLPS